MASLTLLRGEEEGEAFNLNAAETVIGREEGCALRIEGLGLSRRHCLISRQGTHFVVRDLNSENGTWVNGECVSERELRDGDQLGLGVQAILRFRNAAQTAEAPAAPIAQPSGMADAAPTGAGPAAGELAGERTISRWMMIALLVALVALLALVAEFSLRS